MRRAVLALFLAQRLISAGELFHREAAEDTSRPAVGHACTSGKPCPSDTKHHHPSDSHSLCPSCTHMFVHVPQETARVTVLQGEWRIERTAASVAPGGVRLLTSHSRAPPADSI